MRAWTCLLVALAACQGVEWGEDPPVATSLRVADKVPKGASAVTLEEAGPRFEPLTSLPFAVLLADVPLDTQGTVTRGDDWYAISYHLGESHLLVQGTSRTLPHHVELDPEVVASAAGAVTRVEGIAELTWYQDGVSYTLDLECERPLSNPTCTEDDTILQYASSLRVLQSAADKGAP